MLTFFPFIFSILKVENLFPERDIFVVCFEPFLNYPESSKSKLDLFLPFSSVVCCSILLPLIPVFGLFCFVFDSFRHLCGMHFLLLILIRYSKIFTQISQLLAYLLYFYEVTQISSDGFQEYREAAIFLDISEWYRGKWRLSLSKSCCVRHFQMISLTDIEENGVQSRIAVL